jgi:hypothetical protein
MSQLDGLQTQRGIPLGAPRINRFSMLAPILDQVWTGTDNLGRDRIRGTIVAPVQAVALRATARGMALTANNSDTSAVAVPGISTYPFTLVGYGYFNTAGGAWQLGQYTSSSGGTVAAISLQSSTTIGLTLRYAFGTSRTITVTLPTTLGTPIGIVAQILSATDYRLYVNGIMATGTLSPGTLSSAPLDLMIRICHQLNGGMYMQGRGQGKVLSDAQALYISANHDEFYKLFETRRQPRFWGPNTVGGSAIDLFIGDALHGHSAGNLSLTSLTELSVANTLHNHSVDSPALSTDSALAIQSAAHSHTVDNIVLSVTSLIDLIIANATHGHTAGNLALSTEQFLSIQDTLHDHSSDEVTLTLTGSENLSIANANHSHIADNVSLSTSGQISLIVANATHNHSTDNVELSSDVLLVIDQAVHAHIVDNLGLSTNWLLNIASAIHSHYADELNLSNIPSLGIDDSIHLHYVDSLNLSTEALLAIQSAVHGHQVSNIVLVLAGLGASELVTETSILSRNFTVSMVNALVVAKLFSRLH